MKKIVESSLPQKGKGDVKTRIAKAVIKQSNSLENPEESAASDS